jgi:hypothetical protein
VSLSVIAIPQSCPKNHKVTQRWCITESYDLFIALEKKVIAGL